MVKTAVKRARKKKRKALSRSDVPLPKRQSPDAPHHNKFYKINQVPKWVEDPAGECLVHTTAVIRSRVSRREQTLCANLGTNYLCLFDCFLISLIVFLLLHLLSFFYCVRAGGQRTNKSSACGQRHSYSCGAPGCCGCFRNVLVPTS